MRASKYGDQSRLHTKARTAIASSARTKILRTNGGSSSRGISCVVGPRRFRVASPSSWRSREHRCIDLVGKAWLLIGILLSVRPHRGAPQNKRLQRTGGHLGRPPAAEPRVRRTPERSRLTIELTDADLGPYTSSGFAWRWKEPKYDVLSEAVLHSIRALRRTAAGQQFQSALALDRWARDSPEREIRTTGHDESVVTRWLLECRTESEMVLASWSEDEAVYLPWSVFSTYWSSFCYPSSDDVTVWPPSERWALSYSHSGAFYWKSRLEQGVV